MYRSATPIYIAINNYCDTKSTYNSIHAYTGNVAAVANVDVAAADGSSVNVRGGVPTRGGGGNPNPGDEGAIGGGEPR